MSGYRIISSDNHVFEPPDLWQTRMEPRFRDRAPVIVRDEDGNDWWYCDGQKLGNTGFGFGGAQPGQRFEEGAGANLTFGDVFENVRPGGYIPEEQVKDMDIDGVDVSILYPTAGLQLYKQADADLLTRIFKAYNDWLAEFCEASPNRLKPIAMLNVDDVQDASKELERCTKLGFIGAMITVRPPEGHRYDSPEYEPLWAAAQDLSMPLSLHLATDRLGSGPGGENIMTDNGLSFASNIDYPVKMSISDIIFGGVFERYPKLQVGAVEYEVSWAAPLQERMDYSYTQRTHDTQPYRFKENMLPSEYFRRNVFIGFQEDGLGIRLRDVIGVDNLHWGSDYPHHESTFPRSRQILEEILADCTEGEKAKIAGGNAARVYKL